MNSVDFERFMCFVFNIVLIAIVEAMAYKKTLAFLACVAVAFVYWLIAY